MSADIRPWVTVLLRCLRGRRDLVRASGGGSRDSSVPNVIAIGWNAPPRPIQLVRFAKLELAPLQAKCAA